MSIEYRAIIRSFSLPQKALTQEKLMAKFELKRRTGIRFGGPHTEPDPESVTVGFNVEDIHSFGELTIARDSVKKLHLMVEDEIVITIRRAQTAGHTPNDSAAEDQTTEIHGLINTIMADPLSVENRRRSYQSLSKMYPFLLPESNPELVMKATEQQGMEKPSELVRIDIWNETRQAHGTLPIRKEDLARLDLLTGDAVVASIRKSHTGNSATDRA
jgi:hypothetical protein